MPIQATYYVRQGDQAYNELRIIEKIMLYKESVA